MRMSGYTSDINEHGGREDEKKREFRERSTSPIRSIISPPPPRSSSLFWSNTPLAPEVWYEQVDSDHLLPMYSACPIDSGLTEKLLSLRWRQLGSSKAQITRELVAEWMAGGSVLIGTAVAVWFVALIPLWITMVKTQRGDRAVMIPCKFMNLQESHMCRLF